MILWDRVVMGSKVSDPISARQDIDDDDTFFSGNHSIALGLERWR